MTMKVILVTLHLSSSVCAAIYKVSSGSASHGLSALAELLVFQKMCTSIQLTNTPGCGVLINRLKTFLCFVIFNMMLVMFKRDV